MWNLETNTSVELKHSEYIDNLSFSPDSKLLLTSGYGDYTLRMWTDLETENPKSVSTFKNLRRMFNVSFLPDGKRLIYVQGEFIKITDLSFNILKETKIDEGEESGRQCFQLSSNGKYFATFNDKGGLKIWTVEDMKCLYTFVSTHPNIRQRNFTDVSFSFDTTQLITTSSDLTVKVWKLPCTSPVVEIKETPKESQRPSVGFIALKEDMQKEMNILRDEMASMRKEMEELRKCQKSVQPVSVSNDDDEVVFAEIEF